MTLQEQLLDWDNLWLAYQDAARGKRRHLDVAAFELYLGDELVRLVRRVLRSGAFVHARRANLG